MGSGGEEVEVEGVDGFGVVGMEAEEDVGGGRFVETAGDGGGIEDWGGKGLFC